VQRAIDGGSIDALIVTASVLDNVGVEYTACSDHIGDLHIIGRIRLDWRRKEKADQKWSLKYDEWLVTKSPLPDGAQAWLRSSTSQSSTGKTVAPVEGPFLTPSQSPHVIESQDVSCSNSSVLLLLLLVGSGIKVLGWC